MDPLHATPAAAPAIRGAGYTLSIVVPVYNEAAVELRQHLLLVVDGHDD